MMGPPLSICNFASIDEGCPDFVPYIYDEMLRAGKRIFCIGADDNHNTTERWEHDSFGAFTVIRADRLDYRTVTAAMDLIFRDGAGEVTLEGLVRTAQILVDGRPTLLPYNK